METVRLANNLSCLTPFKIAAGGPQHTYHYIVVIIVAGKQMHESEMNYFS